ncbi:methylmalonyl Co-A mutase-associated GTPase MeaB [Halocatena pleomorpha]|uniref:Methylmalonyl Co-A mutase-associated GTPase MeaB n=1 Tax=Halocatena pleomorpha TaxID=1785090 RepID=A0A3P3R6N2_9EURY|nr:methylmalonyl Co-A mutase-associated GTPase MeaB [Halocatena pleomorpha]RRJ29044.1 methylmalonyl Co-A mutase-associated GTPase MeaB [Halocatena pleomorpha]
MSLVSDLLAGDHRALARTITTIENRASGYRDIVSELHEHTGTADVIGVTGSPGAGKSTLVDKLTRQYRDNDLTVGVLAIDPSSPFTGGSVLGDRIRMGSTTGDMDVFVRSMSARGRLGGLSTATADAVKALDAFGKDKIIIETVGAGQNEIDIVKTADTVAVLVPPETGDDIQMLKAGIFEIGDVFVVNKADLSGADRTVKELQEMIRTREDYTTGENEPTAIDQAIDRTETDWEPQVIETIANDGEGVEELATVLQEHAEYLVESGTRTRRAQQRYAQEITTHLREDLRHLTAQEIDARGSLDEFAAAVTRRETDPYTIVDELIAPIEECIHHRADREEIDPER